MENSAYWLTGATWKIAARASELGINISVNCPLGFEDVAQELATLMGQGKTDQARAYLEALTVDADNWFQPEGF